MSDSSATRRPVFLGVLFIIFSSITFTALLLPVARDFTEEPLVEGQVSPYDIRAPASLTFPSQILTSQQQEAAASAVLPVYSPPDTSLARGQLERLRVALIYINSVRSDGYANGEQKTADLALLESLSLSRANTTVILAMSDARWQAVHQESILVLEQVMRNSIREDQLEEVKNSVSTLISLALSEDQAVIVSELVTAFITPNSLYDPALTEAARQQARLGVAQVNRSFVAGETIVQRGYVITPLELEALERFGLSQPQNRWQEVTSAAGLTIVVSTFFVLYLRRNPPLVTGSQSTRNLTVLVALFLAFLFIARLVIPGHTVLPYVYPIMAYSLTVAVLFGAGLGVISTLHLAVLTAFGMPDALALTLFYVLSSIFGIFALRRAQRVTYFFWAGLAVAVSGTIIATAYRLLQPTADWIGLATLAGAAFVNGIASASLGLLFQYFLAQFLGTTTALQLIELSRPDHPLLQFLLRNAPGTYQHSLQLANLVEQAAERINADALLTRVGAMYHDVGKAINPFFFIENQPAGNVNPHNDLDPQESSATIIRHVTDGLDLGRKYRLPRRLLDFISEHHGTTVTRYQYARAVEAAGGDEKLVDIEKFRYPGPRPQSRETALLMLADTSEARMRAERPRDEEELRALIKSVVQNRLDLGQLDDTTLTLRDLEGIIESFTASLRGVFHPRIQYPKMGSEIKTIPLPFQISNKDRRQ